ncbi:hypothetical protein M8009_18315 [Halomonas sp. ATCH28]|uniref:Uncharacterized protein n=1 Tax=Halomonas gemina TaxID=2945105 RepID=A0ABT0T5R6_9GAMM|nr:hypothetical protein [Halomonas gemina]MCL7942237.1 hypothetical protein [Halomonas gemina]
MTPIEQVRLNIGDLDGDYLQDTVLEWLLEQAGNSVQEASIEALETILNQIALNPQREKSGGFEVWSQNIKALERRLESLKKRKKTKRLVPMVFGTGGRSDWKDIDSIFGER